MLPERFEAFCKGGDPAAGSPTATLLRLKTLLIDASQSDSMPKVLDGVNVIEVACCMTFGHSQECLRLYGQVTKRIWWMPWRQQAMKDVVACDKPRGAGKQALIRGFPNGATQPARVICS